MKHENWCITDCKNYYVSDTGSVYSLKSNRKLKAHKDKYYRVVLRNNGKSKTQNIHTLVAKYFCKKGKNHKIVRHINGDANDNNAPNLAWGTYRENEEDKRKHGTLICGEKHAFSKLSDEVILMAKQSKEPLSRIAKRLNVSQGTLWDAVNGRSWKHLN